MTVVSNRQSALAAKSAHALIPGAGYVRVGHPAMPENPVGPPAECLPEADTPDGSVHWLIEPNGQNRQHFVWHKASNEWAPLSPLKGNRIAFTAAYLAAHGWKLQR